MEKKFTKGEWSTNSGDLNRYVDLISGNWAFATVVWNDAPDEQAKANAKLIAAAPNMLDALLETDKDLCVLESTMSQIESTDPRAEGMTELVKKWRERNQFAIKKATK